MNRWFVVSASREVPQGHVAHTQLLGQELVLWRSAAGALNAWENRCPHRGVRLSLGTCVGEELRCRYHAWRFASGSGQCMHIPSHPGQRPASTIRPAVFAIFEDDAFAWVNLSRDALADAPTAGGPQAALRSIFARAPLAAVTEVLLQGYAQQPVARVDEYTLDALRGAAPALRFLLQPVTADATVMHARLQGSIAATDRVAVLREHNALMSGVRDRAEAAS